MKQLVFLRITGMTMGSACSNRTCLLNSGTHNAPLYLDTASSVFHVFIAFSYHNRLFTARVYLMISFMFIGDAESVETLACSNSQTWNDFAMSNGTWPAKSLEMKQNNVMFQLFTFNKRCTNVRIFRERLSVYMFAWFRFHPDFCNIYHW